MADKTKLKILFMSRRFPPSVGGMERFAYELSTALKVQTTRYDVIAWGGSNKWVSAVVLPWLFLRACYKLLTVRGYDILHMQDAVLAPLGWLLSRLSRKPYIVVIHGLDITYQKALYQACILPFVRRADAIIANSRATADEAVQRGVPAAIIEVIPLGITDFEPDPHATKSAVAALLHDESLMHASWLLTVGRLVKRKGAAWFISNVLPRLVADNPAVRYLIAGGGSEQTAILQAIRTSDMEAYVKVLGEISQELKLQLYQTADIFVMPNIKVPGDMEGFGIVAQEAAVAGLPVVASDLEGIADAITSGQNGQLVESQDAAAFTDAIRDLLHRPDDAKAAGQRAREYTLANFSWPAIATRYVHLYEHVVRETKGSDNAASARRNRE